MKIYSYFIFLISLFLLTSCNKDEGFGGSSSLEGYVYNIRHLDDNFSFKTDTFPALDQRVYLSYGKADEDIRTNYEGKYRFEFLRSGNYTVYAHSEFPDGRLEPVFADVKVGGSLTKADTIFIHTGKANGTAMIKGSVMIRYYNKGSLVTINGESSFPAVETRIFLKYLGDETYYDDVRVGDKGIFIFQKVQPGLDYEIYVSTEIPGDKYKNILFPEAQTIQLPNEPYKTYELGEVFFIDINN